MMFLIFSTAALIAGYIIDAIIGDPQGWVHIVRGYGRLISALEKLLYPMKNKRLGGAILAAITLLISAAAPMAVLYAAWRVSPWLYFAVEAILCWQCIAVTCLKAESMRVYTPLVKGDIEDARKRLSWIVGRDTAVLDESGVACAAVETVAENASDGVTAPLIAMALGGAILGCVYKAVNTMDSMIGYKNERYIDFGRFAAKLDDICNYIPSRFCALLMVIASKLCGFDARTAWRIWRRDRRNHSSPNSAQTEAVAAGALNIRLGGPNYYHGKLAEKPYIGDDTHPVEASDILKAHRLLTVTSLLTMIATLIIRGVYALL
jgi:adenosylcobinamide-phosphate synthase